MCDFERQTGLPDAAWPSERDQTYGRIREPLPQHLHVGIAAEKGRERQRQRDAAEFIDCRGVRRRPRAPHERVTNRTRQVKRGG